MNLDFLRCWGDRHARKLARLMNDQRGMLPESTTVGELSDQERLMEWPRPRPVADPLIDELERLFNVPCAPNPRRLA